VNAPYIPPATAAKLNGQIPKGTRHQAALEIAFSLIGNGLSPNAVFQTLRDKFEADVSNSELEKVVSWAVSQNPSPSGFKTAATSGLPPAREWMAKSFTVTKPVEPLKIPPGEKTKWWLDGVEETVTGVIRQSPVTIPDSNVESAMLLFELLYADDEFVNIVCDYLEDDDGKKARPLGSGKTLTSSDWQRYFREKGVPKSKAGAWVRPNPCSSFGSGKEGAITDDDVYDFRFLLVESDTLSLASQLAMFTRLKLTVAAIILSGGLSAHAWVRVDCADEKQYAETAARILKTLEPFGVDRANKNPSRLSRLPGAVRTIGAVDSGRQQLLWVNPKRADFTEEKLNFFEKSMQLPAVDEKPFRKVILQAVDRYEDLIANRGKLGIMTGIADFDRDTGGLKPGQMTVIAAETNGGKSSVAVNFANAALKRGCGVLFITLEMDREEICDLIVSMNCLVNRNCFNTGNFAENDVKKIVAQSGDMSALPLWIDDSPSLTTAQIRDRVMTLKAEGKIGLVILDYIQIVSPANAMEPREQQVANIARDIRALCKESKLPFVVLSQLNDEGKLRESRVVAHEAHNVILLQAEEKNAEPSMLMKVVKGRRIAKRNYKLIYQPQFCRVFSESDVMESDMPPSQNNQPEL
jgi:KaiC/GvpD/RAD55 family RecA-like ATPase